MVALPTSMPAGHEPSADEFQAMLDLLAALTGLPAPTTTASNGTATSGTTETRDAVLGDYVFSVPTVGAAWRYRVIFNMRMSFTVADDVFLINIRNGGASTPTTSSTIVGLGAAVARITGGPGQTTCVASGDFVPGSGTQTLGVFVQRINGTGTCTPVGTRSLSAEFFRTA